MANEPIDFPEESTPEMKRLADYIYKSVGTEGVNYRIREDGELIPLVPQVSDRPPCDGEHVHWAINPRDPK